MVTLFISLLIFGLFAAGLGCSCPSPGNKLIRRSLKQRNRNFQELFLAPEYKSVVRVRIEKELDACNVTCKDVPLVRRETLLRASVIRRFKGCEPFRKYFFVRIIFPGSSCGFSLWEGTEYLMFLDFASSSTQWPGVKSYFQSLCRIPLRWEFLGTEEKRFLRKQKKAGRCARGGSHH